ncbi:MAG: hypothetical protein R3F49_21665 [Planctomycetota bacterium]
MSKAALTLLLALVCPRLDGAPPRAATAAGATQREPRELLLELTRAARLPGSSAERAAAELCRRELEAAGMTVTIRAQPVTIALPTRQDLQAFAGPNEPLALFERFEAFDWDALPTWPVPPVYRNTRTSDARGAVIDAGAGAPADYERLAAQRAEVRGAVVLVRSSAPPATLAREAEARGAAALLVQPARHSEGPYWPEGPWASERSLAGGEVHAACTIPVAPVREAEADALRARLRARRVRDAAGSTVTVQVGPGPVEVRLALEVPARETNALFLAAHSPGPGGSAPAGAARIVAPLASFGIDALAATETVTALAAARLAGAGARGLVIELGPLAVGAASSDRPSALELGPQLGYATDLAGTEADGFQLVERFLDPGFLRVAEVARQVSAAAK